MLIVIGSDHAGFELKEKIKVFLAKKNFDVVDVGAYKIDENDDFSKYAKLLAKTFEQNKQVLLVAICGSGVGMSVALNKCVGIRACVGHSAKEVALARAHNNINCLCLGGRTTSFFASKKMLKAFTKTPFLAGKYKKRMDEVEIKF